MHEDKHLHVIGDEGTKISNMAPFCLNQCFPGGGGGGGDQNFSKTLVPQDHNFKTKIPLTEQLRMMAT